MARYFSKDLMIAEIGHEKYETHGKWADDIDGAVYDPYTLTVGFCDDYMVYKRWTIEKDD